MDCKDLTVTSNSIDVTVTSISIDVSVNVSVSRAHTIATQQHVSSHDRCKTYTHRHGIGGCSEMMRMQGQGPWGNYKRAIMHVKWVSVEVIYGYRSSVV